VTALAGLRIALAQVNPTVGDIDGNAAMVAEWIERARSQGAALVVFPELCIPGYPAEDLYLKRHFAEANRRAVEEIAAGVSGITALVGFAEPLAEAERAAPDAPSLRPVHNALAVLADGRIQAVYRKNRLPNYSVFDERRYFEPGVDAMVIELGGRDAKVGLTICEDVWENGPPASLEAEQGAELIVNPSGSPYHRGKGSEREQMFAERARRYRTAFAFCNLVGGQDELVFDGHSFVVDSDGNLVARARQFEEELLVCDLSSDCPQAEPLDDVAEVYGALVLGLRDYVRKNGFRHVGVGLSGGIDSALVALIAADALGPEQLSCVVMPSPHSSDATQQDARNIARNLGAELIEIPIADAMGSYEDALGPAFDGGSPHPDSVPTDPTRPGEPDLARENIQARIRGNLMMALSNRFGWLVLTTGNKSELSVGYATLYGDMAGGFALIKDVPKTLVYELVRWRNAQAGEELIPASVIERAPSAELRPDQLDTDSLPPYDVLDRVLEAYVEGDQGRDEIAAAGMPADVVERVIGLVDRAEYKRRQAPPGIRITPKAFGRDRRLPITNRFRG
jgi:NAD+ synthase (glutamine-hydrolysing)